MPPVAHRARDARSAIGRLQTMLYRHRWIRWAAAGGAAVAAFMVLGDDPSEPPPAPTAVEPPGLAGLLPPQTRGIPVPVDTAAFAAGDAVDVHAVLDGAAIATGALVVDTSEGEVVVAVPADQVDATVDALATGGVILVLVPQPALEPEP